MNGGQVSFLGDPRLVLTFGQAEAYVGHRLLVTPARFARAKQRGAMRSIARFKLGDRLVRRHTFVVRGLLAGESLPELDHRLAPGIAGEAALQHLERVGDFPVLLGGRRLRAQLLGAGTQLIENVARASHVAIRLPQPVDRFLPLVAETPHAGRFFDQLAAKPGGGLDDEVDIVLRRDRVAILAQAGAGQQRVDVFQSRARTVDQVLALPGAEQTAGDFDLVELDVEPLVGIVDGERAFRHADRRLAGTARVDDVLHLLAPQAAGVALAERPADCIDQVGLAATVGADDRRDAPAEGQLRAAGKGLEPLQPE